MVVEPGAADITIDVDSKGLSQTELLRGNVSIGRIACEK
jgi:hypothetical protein